MAKIVARRVGEHVDLHTDTRVSFETQGGGKVTCWLENGRLVVASDWDELLVVGQAANKITVWESQ